MTRSSGLSFRRRFAACALALCALMIAARPAAAEPERVLWSKGDAKALAVACGPKVDARPSGGECTDIAAVKGGVSIVANGGYMSLRVNGARVIWRKMGAEIGPDVLVMGEWGGSAGDVDVLAITFDHGPKINKLSFNRADDLTAKTVDNALRFEAPLTIGGFNDAPNSETVASDLPVSWRNGDYALDLEALTHAVFTPADMNLRKLAIGWELEARANAIYPAAVLYPIPPAFAAQGGTPLTVQALLDLMLAGHADKARALLHSQWPKHQVDHGEPPPMAGEEAFWNDLCAGVVRHPLWTRFNLARLPNAAMIEAAAAEAKPRPPAP